jgi:hypothetical protein
MSQFCPICRKPKSEDELFCPECSKKIQYEYEIDLSRPNGARNIDNPSPVAADDAAFVNPVEEQHVSSAETGKEGKKSSHKSTKIWGWIIVAVLLLAGGGFAGYTYYVKGLNVDRSAWESAQHENTVKAYVAYMDQFPHGKYFAEAQSKMLQLKNEEAAAWEKLQSSDNIVAFKNFLKTYPQSPYKSLVLNRLDSLQWNATLNANNVRSYSDYMVSADSGEIPGIFYNDAQKRYEMLFQSYPVDSVEFNAIRMTMDAFFIALSNVDYNKMKEKLAPNIYRFFDSGNITRDKLIGELMVAGAKTAKPTIKFEADIDALQYQKTFNGHFKINIPLTKTYTDNNGKPVTVRGYIVHAELDDSYHIIGIYETKPYTSAP